MNRAIVLVMALAGCGRAAGVQTAEPAPVAACRPAEAPVEWLVPESEQSLLDAWCAAVGGPVLLEATPVRSREAMLASAGPMAAPEPHIDSLAIVTWNVHVGGGDLYGFVQRLRTGDFTNGEPVEHFVLLLQEAHRGGAAVPAHVGAAQFPRGFETRPPSGRRRDVATVARELGLSLAYVPSMRNGEQLPSGAHEDRGNAILATLPVHDVVAIELPVVRQRRVVVVGHVRGWTSAGRAWRLQLASVHLENRPAYGITGERERGEQMQHALRKMPPAELRVIGGDLNTWTRGVREPAVAAVWSGHRDAGPPPAFATYNGPAFFNLPLDYIFARVPGGRVSGYQRVEDRQGSDHHPVVAWVHLPY